MAKKKPGIIDGPCNIAAQQEVRGTLVTGARKGWGGERGGKDEFEMAKRKERRRKEKKKLAGKVLQENNWIWGKLSAPYTLRAQRAHAPLELMEFIVLTLLRLRLAFIYAHHLSLWCVLFIIILWYWSFKKMKNQGKKSTPLKLLHNELPSHCDA